MSRRGLTTKLKLKCGLKVPATGAESALHTPNTPEILNTIVNITETLGHPTSLLSLPPTTTLQVNIQHYTVSGTAWDLFKIINYPI